MKADTKMHLIYNFTELVEEKREEPAQFEALDKGKSYKVALIDDVETQSKKYSEYREGEEIYEKQ